MFLPSAIFASPAPNDLFQLDRASVKWLEQYLISHKNITCLIVSHDSGCVPIIDLSSEAFIDSSITSSPIDS